MSTSEVGRFKVKDLIEQAEQQLANGKPKRYFKIRTMNQCLEDAAKLPKPKPIFDGFCTEAEITMLFAGTGVGKSLLAVQICDSVSRGKLIPGFKGTPKKQKTLLFDFELGDKQLQKRYSNDDYEESYKFDKNFSRVVIDIDSEIPDEDHLEVNQREMEQAIIETGATFIVVDNLTYMEDDAEKARKALPLMKHLKYLKTKYKLTIIIISHTPKRDLSRVLTINDMSGSMYLMNFCDSAFAIGKSSQGEEIRYLKQIKVRNAELKYGESNIVVCRLIQEGTDNFTKFEFIEYGDETDHLKKKEKTKKGSVIDEVLRMKQIGSSNREIAKKHGVDEKTIRNWIQDDLPF